MLFVFLEHKQDAHIAIGICHHIYVTCLLQYDALFASCETKRHEICCSKAGVEHENRCNNAKALPEGMTNNIPTIILTAPKRTIQCKYLNYGTNKSLADNRRNYDLPLINYKSV